jgi:hypothetical protein
MSQSLDQIDRQLTEIDFLLNKTEWTEQDETRYGKKADLKVLRLELWIERSTCLDKTKKPTINGFLKNLLLTDEKYMKDPMLSERPPMIANLFTTQYIQINLKYLISAGLDHHDLQNDPILYCRDEVKKLFTCLSERVIQDHKTLWILGAPGVGKSLATLAFIASLDQDKWLITWIHISEYSTRMKCVRYSGETQIEFYLEYEDLDNFLDRSTQDNHIIVVDGFLPKNEAGHSIESRFNGWIHDQQNSRYLIFVCCMTIRYKAKIHEDEAYGIEEHFMFSWKLTDFQEAVSDDKFLSQVSSYLDALPAKSEISNQLAEKFLSTGGSVRYMFQLPTERVKKCITKIVSEILWDEVSIPIRRFDKICDIYDDFNHRKQRLVSPFASNLMAVMSQPAHWDRVEFMLQLLGGEPARDLIHEISCFTDLRTGILRLGEESGEKRSFRAVKFALIDMKDKDDVEISDGSWYKPIYGNFVNAFRMNQSTSALEILQTAIKDNHTCNLNEIRIFIDQLSSRLPGKVVNNVRIYCLVRSDFVERFKLTIEGSLGFPGLTKGEEVNNIKVIGTSRSKVV